MQKLISKITIGLIVASSLLISIPASYAQDITVAELEIIDYPETVESFVDFSFKVRALDDIGEVVPNYTGTVEFTSETDINAELPPEYEFTLEDAGEHDFTESYFFTEAGTQSFTVTDKDNEELTTTIEIEVVDDELPGLDETITITSPTAGNTTNSTITVRGSTTPGVTVTVLNGEEILGTTDASPDGSFEYTSDVLPDGTYNIKATTENASSDTVTVSIDTSTPELSFFSVAPSTALPSSNVTVTVSLQTEARAVKTILGGIQTPLTKDETNPKIFTGTVAAPSAPGEYEIKLEIEDSLGNLASDVATDKTLTVSTDAGTGNEQIIGNNGTPTFQVPSQVTGLQAQVSDRRVTLSWAPATASAGVKNYAIYYGQDPNNLNFKVETNDANTAWFIPELTNNQNYYFQVYGVDNNGNRSDLGSQIIGASPNLLGTNTLHGSAPGQVVVNQTTESGPGGLALLAGGSWLSAKLLRRRRRQS